MNKYKIGDLVALEGYWRITKIEDSVGGITYKAESDSKDNNYCFLVASENILVKAPEPEDKVDDFLEMRNI